MNKPSNDDNYKYVVITNKKQKNNPLNSKLTNKLNNKSNSKSIGFANNKLNSNKLNNKIDKNINKTNTKNNNDKVSGDDNNNSVNQKYKTTKLSQDNYIRPKITATDLIDPDEIKERLKNFEKVEDISSIVPNIRIQYFEITDDKKFRYRQGGTLIVNKYPDYIVLSNGRKSWSVQIANHVFFKQIDIDEIRKQYEKIIADKDRKIEEMTHYIGILKKANESKLKN